MKTKEEASHFYRMINELIDEYIENWGVEPKNLKKYLKVGTDNYNRFLRRNNLHNIEKIDIIINDVLNDRIHFGEIENKMLENMNNITYEKILADYYNSSLGHITSSGNNKYTITDVDGDIYCAIYNKEDLKNFRNEIIQQHINNIENAEIIHDFGDFETLQLGNIDITNSIDTNKLRELLRNKYQTKEIINMISNRDGMKFKKEYMGYFIFQQ